MCTFLFNCNIRVIYTSVCLSTASTTVASFLNFKEKAFSQKLVGEMSCDLYNDYSYYQTIRFISIICFTLLEFIFILNNCVIFYAQIYFTNCFHNKCFVYWCVNWVFYYKNSTEEYVR